MAQILAAPRLFGLGCATAALVIILDQLSKHWVFDQLLAGQEQWPLSSFFRLVKWQNTGLGLSLFSTDHPVWPWIVGMVVTVIAMALAVWLARCTRLWPALASGLVIGGAMGNVIDRIRFGAIRDFLLFHWGNVAFPAFNLADLAALAGIFMLVREVIRDWDRIRSILLRQS